MEKESRVEFLRRQRLLQGEQKIRKITHRAAEKLDENPVSHSTFNLNPFKKKAIKNANSERPFPISANEMTEEAQKKKIRKIRIGWRFFSAILTLFFTTCLLVAWRSADFQVSSILITGAQRISPEVVQAVINENQKPIFTVIPEEIIGQISHAFPEFKDIQVSASLPNKIIINLTERIPMLAWKINEDVIWVDEEGIIIPARGEYNGLLTIESANLPVFSHPTMSENPDPGIEKNQKKLNYWKLPPYSMIWYEYHHYIDPGLLNAIIHLNSQIPNKRTFLFDSHRGLGWNDDNGWKIFVGLDLSKINEKLQTYEKIVSELTSKGIHPSLVSVEYLHAPYYRLD